MNARGAENLLTSHLTEDENHNYLCSRIVAVEDNEFQLSGDGEYHTLTLVPTPTVGNDETSHNVEEQKETQKEKNSSGLSFGEDEFLSNNVTESDNRFWEDQSPNFSCTSCSYAFRKRHLLLRHLKTHNRQKRNSEIINSNKDKEQLLADVIKECSKKYVDTDDDDRDKLVQSFACNQCNYSPTTKYLLLRHARTHSGVRPYKCRICEHGFTTGSSLEAHYNTHYGVKKKICKFCSTPFTTSGELSRHLKYKHTQEKPHKCNECDYAAVERSKLLRHMRYHTGERPFQCQHCTYASQDSSQLRRHMRTHTGEKPYKCDHCNVAYANSTSLKLHKRVHNPSEDTSHSSEMCPAKNAKTSKLRQHFQRIN